MTSTRRARGKAVRGVFKLAPGKCYRGEELFIWRLAEHGRASDIQFLRVDPIELKKFPFSRTPAWFTFPLPPPLARTQDNIRPGNPFAGGYSFFLPSLSHSHSFFFFSLLISVPFISQTNRARSFHFDSDRRIEKLKYIRKFKRPPPPNCAITHISGVLYYYTGFSRGERYKKRVNIPYI